jgi:hypothetical protein
MSQPNTPYPFQKAAVKEELIQALGSRKVSDSYVDRRVIHGLDRRLHLHAREADGPPPLADIVCWRRPGTCRRPHDRNAHRVPVTPACGGAQEAGARRPVRGSW